MASMHFDDRCASAGVAIGMWAGVGPRHHGLGKTVGIRAHRRTAQRYSPPCPRTCQGMRQSGRRDPLFLRVDRGLRTALSGSAFRGLRLRQAVFGLSPERLPARSVRRRWKTSAASLQRLRARHEVDERGWDRGHRGGRRRWRQSLRLERSSLCSTENSEKVAVGRRNDLVDGRQPLCGSNVHPTASRSRSADLPRCLMLATRLLPDIRAASNSDHCLGSR